jgi:hypothetical protein
MRTMTTTWLAGDNKAQFASATTPLGRDDHQGARHYAAGCARPRRRVAIARDRRMRGSGAFAAVRVESSASSTGDGRVGHAKARTALEGFRATAPLSSKGATYRPTYRNMQETASANIDLRAQFQPSGRAAARTASRSRLTSILTLVVACA